MCLIGLISLIGLIRKYLVITFDLKNLWFIIRVHLTNLTLDIELDTWSIDLTNNFSQSILRKIQIDYVYNHKLNYFLLRM